MTFMRVKAGLKDRNGIGGFLEAILAAMAVITAASIFLVTISAGAVRTDGELEQEHIAQALREQGLWPDQEVLAISSLPSLFETLPELEGVHGLRLSYRLMGDQTPLLCLGGSPPADAASLVFRSPALLLTDGRSLAGIAEATAW